MRKHKYQEREGEVEGWFRPRQTVQRTLWPQERDEALASVYVSIDSLDRWREKGWLSFDARTMSQLNEPEQQEIVFLRNLAESGLPDAIVGRMLDLLPKPYSYKSVETSYNFALGWVALPPFSEDDVDVFMAEYLEEWVRGKLQSGDTKLAYKLFSVILQHKLQKEKDNNQTESE